MESIDQKLEKISGKGIYNILLFSAQMALSMYYGYQTSLVNFFIPTIDHWCKIDSLKDLPPSDQKYIAIPDGEEDGEYSHCQVFDLPWDSYNRSDYESWNRTLIESSVSTRECTEWMFDSEDIGWTLTQQLSMVCSNRWQQDLTSAMFTAGLFIGSVFSGPIGDWIGRKTVFVSFLAVHAAASYATAFSPSITLVCIFRFIAGAASRASGLATWTLLAELTSNKRRIAIGSLTRFSVSFGIVICAAFAYGLRDYVHLQVTVAAFATAGLIFYTVLLVESPRWLLQTGRTARANKSIQRIVKLNSISQLCGNKVDISNPDNTTTERHEYGDKSESEKNQIVTLNVSNLEGSPQNHNTVSNGVSKSPVTIVIEDVDAKKQEDHPKSIASFWKLFHNKYLRRTTLVVHFLWISSQFVYISLTLTVGALAGDVYLNVIISGIIELPVTLILHIAVTKYGGRPPIIVSFILATITCALTIPLDMFESTMEAATILIIICRALTGMAYGGLNVVTPELYPTEVRQRAIGTSVGIPAGFAIAGPYVGGSLRSVWEPLPSMIYTALLIPACFLALYVPETLNQPLPDTFEDAEELSRTCVRGYTHCCKKTSEGTLQPS